MPVSFLQLDQAWTRKEKQISKISQFPFAAESFSWVLLIILLFAMFLLHTSGFHHRKEKYFGKLSNTCYIIVTESLGSVHGKLTHIQLLI